MEELRLSIDEILTDLNSERIPCTCSAVAEVLRIPPPSLANQVFGIKRPETSWVVNAQTGRPTGYSFNQMHPELFRTNYIIATGHELRQCLRSRRGE